MSFKKLILEGGECLTSEEFKIQYPGKCYCSSNKDNGSDIKYVFLPQFLIGDIISNEKWLFEVTIQDGSILQELHSGAFGSSKPLIIGTRHLNDEDTIDEQLQTCIQTNY
jgi:hypothetical protein